MSVDRLEITPGLILDARGAAWLPESGTLAVADTHLGYAWIQRRRGQLLPVAATAEDTVPRLAALVREFAPRRLVILGDVVHAAPDLEPVAEALRGLRDALPGDLPLVLCLGNHDRQLARRMAEWRIAADCVSHLNDGRFVLLHGDESAPAGKDAARYVLLGHEHPCLVLDDGAATSARVPCFLSGPAACVLPAFSPWAAGCVVGRDRFLGPIAREAVFEHAVACLGPRLLRFPLGKSPKTPASRSGPVRATHRHAVQ